MDALLVKDSLSFIIQLPYWLFIFATISSDSDWIRS